MSRSLHFAPVAPPPPSTDLGGVPVRSLFLDAFGPEWGAEPASGDEAFRLTRGDLSSVNALLNVERARLRRMREAPARNATGELAYAACEELIAALQDVADAIEKHGELRFWLE